MSAMPPPPPPGQQPPGQQPPGQSPYGQQPYGYQPYGASRAIEHPQGTTVLVMGILSIVVCGVLGPIAWGMGNKAMREMDANPQITYSNRSNVNAGRICGIVGTVLMVLGILAFIVVIAAASSMSTT